jgi:hypothetical protein
MANRYDLLQNEFGGSPDINVSPVWVLCVLSFDEQVTASKAKIVRELNKEAGSESESVSFNSDNSSIVKIREKIIIVDDCLRLSVHADKGSHVHTMSATMIESGRNYLSRIFPDDWLIGWILNDESQLPDLIERIKTGQACNKFEDGLKFVGRVQSIFETKVQEPSGKNKIRYELQGVGFGELDSQIFYNRFLQENSVSIGQYLGKLGVAISDLINPEKNAAIDINKAIPALLKLFLGEGVSQRFAAPGGIRVAEGLVQDNEAKYAYAIPTEVGLLLGKAQDSKGTGILSYSDILELLMGVQSYGQGKADDSTVFTPIGTPTGHVNQRKINDLMGEFMPIPVDFADRPVWSVLEEYLNSAINEMFTTLRVNTEGQIVPTLVARQLPFTSETMGRSLTSFKTTRFLELPRWYAHPALVQNIHRGRSRALAFNFVNVRAQPTTHQHAASMEVQYVRIPPVRDETNIKRSGIRAFSKTVAASDNESMNGPRDWMKIVSDFAMGQQLMLTGSAAIIGISSPISVGDNFEIAGDGIVFHIESVLHDCAIDANGHRRFVTNLALTHGVRSDDDTVQDIKTPANPDVTIYSPMFPEDNRTFNPGVAAESAYQDEDDANG